MKIRAITLRNVRRFAGKTARLSGIADGITTITEPNETGKSTFFDALHALFFLAHGSSTAEVRSLQPYSKGAVDIAADIEAEHGRYRIQKSFLASKSAVITDLDSGQIIAQAGEAEAWIARTIGADMSGPAGLLWVRQGISGFGPDGSGPSEKRERERLREERQSLMSSVAGQIDSVTGGRRMDLIMKTVEADIDALATKALGPKTSGEWGKAVKLVQELTEDQDVLQEQVASLEHALQERSAIRVRLDDPKAVEAQDKRAEALERITTERETARQHARLIETAVRDLKLAELTLKTIEDRIAARASLAKRQERLNDDKAKATAKLETATAAMQDIEEALTLAQQAHQTALAVLANARRAEQAVRQQQDRAAAAKRHTEISDLLGRVAGYEAQLKTAREARRAQTITKDALDALENLDRKISTSKERRDAGATTLRITYDTEMRVTSSAGQVLDAGAAVPVHSRTDFILPGIGRLEVTPPRNAGTASETPEHLEQERRQNLSALGLDSVAAARSAFALAEAALREEEAARGALAALVPDGTDELRRTLAEVAELAELAERDEEDAEPVPDQAVTVEDATTAEAFARERLDIARQDQSRAAQASLEAKTTLRLAQEALQNLAGEMGEETQEDLSTPHADALGQVGSATAALDSLRASAPDLETLEAEHQRLVSAQENAKAERARLGERLSELNGLISARAEDGVETRLSEVRDARAQAQDRADRYAFEVKVLAELRSQLEQARKAARDAYFEPVVKELSPLIAMLHEGAELQMDPETMLPRTIRRNGIEDDFEMLSGGAAEQIAILTRLAFARLYAKQGRQVPVILDDALVYSDDDRIIRMFTALTKISKDQQIIVFSCRSRAFDELGGHRPRIEVESL